MEIKVKMRLYDHEVNMKKIGIVRDINHRGELLLKGGGPGKPGTPVFDSRKNRVGKVVRTFGPVDSPYLLVKIGNVPEKDRMEFLNAELYTE